MKLYKGKMIILETGKLPMRDFTMFMKKMKKDEKSHLVLYRASLMFRADFPLLIHIHLALRRLTNSWALGEETWNKNQIFRSILLRAEAS